MWSGKVFSGIWDLTNIHAQCRLLENARCLKGRWDFTATQETGFAKISCFFFFFWPVHVCWEFGKSIV